jgi:undecaprenyl-diphosphatase
MAGLVATLVLLFVALALLVRHAGGTPVDLAITRGIQQVDSPALLDLMVAVSAIGYWPWSWLAAGVASLVAFAAGFRREALFVLATPGASAISALVKLAVERPRPSGDAVRVIGTLTDFSYPSGHVVGYVSLYGLLFFLVYVLARRSWKRTVVLWLLGLLIVLVGISRVYLGYHWASDVLGGYALGAAYLLLLIETYRLLVGLRERPREPPAALLTPTSPAGPERLATDRDPLDDRARLRLAHRGSRARGWRFEPAVLLAMLLAGALTMLARSIAYFPLDVQLAWAIQHSQAPWLDTLFRAVSWIGFPPQSNVIFGAAILGLLLAGLWLEALLTLFAALGSAGLWLLIVAFVDRPRPSPDLVHVATQLPYGSFPSGHALNLTATFGFLISLVLALVPHAWWRRALVALLAIPILLIGVARVYEGAHWPSDVLGGYLIGGIWLALTIRLYQSARAWLARRREAASRVEPPALDRRRASGSG